ncbi:gliding motility-associated-like protein [Spirosoma oryzae]|uniref:Gliding motility-associated-like protein n=1 Tax=Spirosoma oryzae TaxID=1469603 RepID=A0A2T0SSR9_9BACT|nr:PKD domain-containing protein [Spirosoma oryzae]PRY36454.1 gliding motility-associated-like protein [Spirosoma oryzae]
MKVFTKCTHLTGLLWLLWLLCLLLGAGSAWAQTEPKSFTVTTQKFCVPDRDCGADSIRFVDLERTGVTTRVWNFGDGSSAVTKTAVADSAVNHVFQQAGTYTVTLTRTTSATTVTTSQFVTIFDRPQSFAGWRTDTTICQGERITLDPYASGPPQSGLTFLWYPKGQTTQSIDVDSSGCYSVEVTNQSGCTYQDRINVDVCGEKKESQGVKWYFGQNAGLDFGGGGTPKPITDGNLSTIEGSSSIANTKGQLLFYTDGITIYGKDGKPLRSLDPRDSAATATPIRLGGNRRSTQSALIVPKPTCRGCEYLYYVYTTTEINGTKQLAYSIVDMRQEKGKGAVIQKNIPINAPGQGTEQSASVKNERDSTFWVINRVFGTNQYQVRHLTKADNPSSATTITGGTSATATVNGEGYMKIGPADTASVNGASRPMAVVVPGPPRNSVELFTFNDSTGALTYNKTIDLGPAPPKAYGVEFSPDGKSLYITMLADTNSDGSQKGLSYIVSYDLNQPDSLLARSRTVIDSSSTRQYGSIQIGPDGRIYVAVKGSNTLGTIENPNGGLLDSLRFNPAGQSLGGKTSQLGLPNLVSNFNDQSSGPGFTYSDTCARQPTVFQGSPNCPKLKETYTWSFGDGSVPVSTTALQPQRHTYQQPGQYKVSFHIVTQNSTGGICKDTIIDRTITILATPEQMNLGPDTVICNRRGITLDLKVPATNYVWLVNGAVAGRQKTITFTQPGFYYAIGFASNGECYKSDTIRVQIRPVPSLNLGPDTLTCYKLTIELTVPQQVWRNFRWNTGATTKTITTTAAGVYSVTATFPTDNAVCENSDTIRVSELPKIQLRAALTGPRSCTSADGAIALTVTPAGSYTYTYAWTRTDGAVLPGTAQLTNLVEGRYSVRVTDSVHTCRVDSAFQLKSTANQLALTPTVRDALCSIPNSGTISLNITGGTAVAYVWLDQNNNLIASTPIFDKAAPGRYNVQVQDANGCKANRDSIVVGLDSAGFARLAAAPPKCIGQAVSLSLVTGDLTGNVYQWSNGATSPTINVSQPGSYSVTVTNTQTGCKGSSSVQVADRPAPNFSFTQQAALCVGDQGRTQLVANGATGLQFRWLGSDGRPLADTARILPVSQVGNYILRVTDPLGCTASATASVINQCEPRVNVPDAFSPNNDGINDQFQVFSNYITDYEMRVYNRWGEVIFVSTNPEQKWDGTYRGSDYPSMLYPYVLTYKSESFPDRGKLVKRGSVLLVR